MSPIEHVLHALDRLIANIQTTINNLIILMQRRCAALHEEMMVTPNTYWSPSLSLRVSVIKECISEVHSSAPDTYIFPLFHCDTHVLWLIISFCLIRILICHACQVYGLSLQRKIAQGFEQLCAQNLRDVLLLVAQKSPKSFSSTPEMGRKTSSDAFIYVLLALLYSKCSVTKPTDWMLQRATAAKTAPLRR